MRMYFELDYNRNGIIGGCNCTERQTYDVTLENPHKVIRKDLSSVMKLMDKRSSVYLRIGYGEDVSSDKQMMCVSQSVSDRDNEVFEVYLTPTVNQSDTKKVGAGAVKRMVIDLFDKMVCESKQGDPATVIDDATKNLTEILNDVEVGTAEANAIANDFDKDDVAEDGTPYSQVMQEIVEDEKKAKKSTTKKKEVKAK